jgi:hypothetical protein
MFRNYSFYKQLCNINEIKEISFCYRKQHSVIYVCDCDRQKSCAKLVIYAYIITRVILW